MVWLGTETAHHNAINSSIGYDLVLLPRNRNKRILLRLEMWSGDGGARALGFVEAQTRVKCNHMNGQDVEIWNCFRKMVCVVQCMRNIYSFINEHQHQWHRHNKVKVNYCIRIESTDTYLCFQLCVYHVRFGRYNWFSRKTIFRGLGNI